jgi:hypothetical protein
MTKKQCPLGSVVEQSVCKGFYIHFDGSSCRWYNRATFECDNDTIQHILHCRPIGECDPRPFVADFPPPPSPRPSPEPMPPIFEKLSEVVLRMMESRERQELNREARRKRIDVLEEKDPPFDYEKLEILSRRAEDDERLVAAWEALGRIDPQWKPEDRTAAIAAVRKLLSSLTALSEFDDEIESIVNDLEHMDSPENDPVE